MSPKATRRPDHVRPSRSPPQAASECKSTRPGCICRGQAGPQEPGLARVRDKARRQTKRSSEETVRARKPRSSRPRSTGAARHGRHPVGQARLRVAPGATRRPGPPGRTRSPPQAASECKWARPGPICRGQAGPQEPGLARVRSRRCARREGAQRRLSELRTLRALKPRTPKTLRAQNAQSSERPRALKPRAEKPQTRTPELGKHQSSGNPRAHNPQSSGDPPTATSAGPPPSATRAGGCASRPSCRPPR